MEYIGPIGADFDGHGFYRDGAEISLTPMEARLLKLLWDNYGHGVSRLTIAEVVWDDQGVSEGAIDSLFYRLRCRVGKGFIQCQIGFGYRIAPQE